MWVYGVGWWLSNAMVSGLPMDVRRVEFDSVVVRRLGWVWGVKRVRAACAKAFSSRVVQGINVV